MSLDLYICTIVQPSLANETFKISEYSKLKIFQESGLLNVFTYQVGRNCLTNKWHKINSLLEKEEELYNFCIVLPEEFNNKLKPFLIRKRMPKYAFFNKPEKIEFDFYYISW